MIIIVFLNVFLNVSIDFFVTNLIFFTNYDLIRFFNDFIAIDRIINNFESFFHELRFSMISFSRSHDFIISLRLEINNIINDLNSKICFIIDELKKLIS